MSKPLDRGKLVELTSEVVSAYVSSNRVAPAELETIIGSVAGSLAVLGNRTEPAPERPEPAVPVRRSVGRDRLICLVCGKKQKMLKRHLAVRHQLSPDEYRGRFDLRSDYPLVAPSYAAQRSEVARQTGLGRKPAPTAPAPKSATSKSSSSRKQRTAGRGTRPKASAPRRRRATTQSKIVTRADQDTTAG
jgi:predicted transcriptional regulator